MGAGARESVVIARYYPLWFRGDYRSCHVLFGLMAVETLGEPFSAGWRIRVRCAWGPRDGVKRVRECVYGGELDLQTLIWTRGRDCPLTMLESRLKYPRCGSRRVRLAFSAPRAAGFGTG